MLKNTLKQRAQNQPMDEPSSTPSTGRVELPALLSEKEAAAYLGVSLGYLRRARTEGVIGRRTPGPRFIRIQGDVRGGRNAGRILYPKSELDEWLAALKRQTVI
jgi:hypothetical protein